LEERHLLAVDYGDAPDMAIGTGTGNYNTLAGDNGPSHTIVAGLRLGATVDGDSGLLQNAAASADDVNAALPDDEDGLANPAADLVLTAGAAPTINVWATNTTGAAATLYGWIDYNADGVFDNATERASVAVPNGTNSGVVTLVFPVLPTGFSGTTFARFRLSTDVTAANPTAAAADGEIEDYLARIVNPSSGTVDPSKTMKIAHELNGGPSLSDVGLFGRSLTSLGDLDGDGIADLAVGVPGDATGGNSRGAVYVLFLNANGSVQSSLKIASGTNGGPNLANGDSFGCAVASLGDLDGDGVIDLAVGAYGDNAGAVHVLFLNANGSVKSSLKIASNMNGGPSLAGSDVFGGAIASLGDLDGDGVSELAVGATGDNTGGPARGAVHVLFLNANGSVKSARKIANGTNGGPSLKDADVFGSSTASLGDLDGDGVTDLAVGATGDDTGGSARGAIYVLFLNGNGSVKSARKISDGTNGGPSLEDSDVFGNSLAFLGDVDGDGVADLAVGAAGDNTGGANRGAAHMLFLSADGTAKRALKIANTTNGGPTLSDYDVFGSSIVSLGDLDGDGVADLAIGSRLDDTGGVHRGAVYVLFLQSWLPGDYSLDGKVDAADYVVWRKSLGANVPSFTGADGNGDGVVDQDDYLLWRANFGNARLKLRQPGDFNLDSSVDAADYVVWRRTNGTRVPSFTGADGTGDGVVDQDDNLHWRANFGNAQPATAGAIVAREKLSISAVTEWDAALPVVVQPSSLLFDIAALDGLRPELRGNNGAVQIPNSTISISRCDDMLVAWLAPHDNGAGQGPDVDYLDPCDKGGEANALFGALALAIESFGAEEIPTTYRSFEPVSRDAS
jgi:hypothetical protein